MALTKKIQIDGQDVIFRASAAIPRIYRLKFGRDIFKDLMELEKSMKKNDEDKSNLDIGSLELFENIAYVMAKHGDKSVPDSPEEWLDNFSTFSIYQSLLVWLLPCIYIHRYSFLWTYHLQVQLLVEINQKQKDQVPLPLIGIML